MNRLGVSFCGLLSFCLCLTGCVNKIEEQTKPTGSIIGKTTQDIKKFDPESKAKVSDSKVKVDDPVLAPLQAYRPMIEQTSKLQIDHAINLFKATENRPPKDYDEFMERIIKENNIKLPVLPGKWEYRYDEKNAKLEIVEKK